MTIGERLQQIRGDMNQEKFGSKIGVSKHAISGYENSKRTITDRVITDVCREFNVNESWLRAGEGNMFTEPFTDIIVDLTKKYDLDDIDQRLVLEYAKLNKEQKQIIKDFMKNALKEEAETVKNTKDSVIDFSASKKELQEEHTRKLPLYDYPASAGRGVFAGEGEYELVEVSDDVPLSANFGVRIKGDSMTPKIFDGAIAWVRQQPDVDYGDMCIVVINDEGYCKVKTSEGFKSINFKYKTIKPTEADTWRINGKVVYVENPE